MTMDWFRSWHGAPTDNKWLLIGKRAGVAPGIVSAVVWALLDYASRNTVRGSIEGFDTETYAIFSGFEEAQIGSTIKALKDKELIVDDRFKAWDERQPKKEDDGVAERKRLQRERDKEKAASVTPCHAESQDVTLDKIREEEIKKEEKDLSSKDPKIPKTKTVIEKPEEVSAGIWNDFVSLRKKKRAPITETALDGIRDEAQKAGWVLQRALAECCARGWQGFKAEWVAEQSRGQAPPKKTFTDNHRAAGLRAFQNSGGTS